MKFHLHWYREQFNTTVWSYRECRCGKRQIVRMVMGHQPKWSQWEKMGKVKPQYRSKKDRDKIVKIKIGERV
jgi:hypothetical protein